jgi:cytochrome b561
MSSAAASAVSWFGLIPVPHLVTADPGLAATLESVHGSLAWLLLSLAVIHIGAALKHSLLDKFGAIARITSAGPMLAFVAVIVGGVTMLVPGDQGPTSYARRAAETSPLSEPPVWAIDYESSFIRFTVTEKGNSVGGELTDWTAEIRFDEANLEASLIDAILATAVAERDAALPESEGMDSDNPPTARFHASSFRRGPDGGFAAAGVLTVEGRQSPALLAFTVERGNDRTILDGTALLDGRALPANSAESADTGPAGRDVPVVVHIETLDQRASPN